MVFVSLTRLRVRSLRFLLQFIWQALKAARQAERSAGFLGGRLLREAKNTFWTITAWEIEAAMRSYRNSGTHRNVMPRLLEWCDEASIAHWTQADGNLPDWIEAHRRLITEGRLSKVHHPSPAQLGNQIVEPEQGRTDRILNPVKSKGS